MTKSLLLRVSLATLAVLTASAAPINITVNSLGLPLNGNGTADSVQYGQIDTSPTSDLIFLNNTINLWNSVYNPDLPAAGGTVAFDDGSAFGTTYTAPAGYDYAVFHFEQGSSLSVNLSVAPAGYWQAWSLNGSGGSFSVPIVSGQPFGTFTTARYYNRLSVVATGVPDSGATCALLALGAVALEALRRKMAGSSRSPRQSAM